MKDRIYQYQSDFWHWVCSLNYQEWFLALVATVVVGVVLLRGFGSRKNY